MVLNVTLILEPNSLRVSFSQSRSFETTETLSFLVYFFTLFEFLDNPKLKGYVYDNIVCDLKVMLENFYQNFYFELNVKSLFSDFVQRTMDMVIDDLPKSKFEMRLVI